MADKSISELVAATAVGSPDLFVLEQGGTAKKLTGQILENWLVALADGHGGIQTIAKTGTSGLVDTYTITYADTTTSTFTVTNGKAISSITQYWRASSSSSTVPSSWSTTRETMTPTNKYLWSYMRISYNDGTYTDTTKSVVGVYGDTGAQTYVWIKYAAINPTSDSDMADIPDNWIGIYVGLSSTAPTAYTSYAWFQYKGEKGDTGDASEIVAQSVTYMESSSGTVVPSGSWTPTIPTVAQGNFLWTKTELSFNDQSTVIAYSVSRYGVDGTGSVVSVNSISPDGNGNVSITANDIQMDDNTSVQDGIDALEGGKVDKAGDTMTGTLIVRNSAPRQDFNNTSTDVTSATYESTQNPSGSIIFDKNNYPVVQITDRYETDGSTGIIIGGAKRVNAQNIWNYLRLLVKPNGSHSVMVSSPQAWREALGLGTSGAFPLTIAEGGTGATSAANAISALGGVRIVQIADSQFTGTGLADLVASMNRNQGTIPTGISVLQLGSVSQANKAMVLVSKISGQYGGAFAVSYLATMNGAKLRIVSNNWVSE